MAQGDEPNAKDDTRFYSVEDGGGLSDLATDLSHQADDISVGTNSVYESGAQARWDTAGPAAWELDIEFGSEDEGHLFIYERDSEGVRLVLTESAGAVEAYVDDSLVATVTPPGVGESDDRYIVSWSMEDDPLSANVRSELRVYNVTDDLFVTDVAVHSAPTSTSTDAVWLAMNSSGDEAFTGTANQLRFSVGRFHPWAEAREDFVANTSAPTLELETRREVPVPTRVSGVGDDDQFTGPVYMAVAAGLGQSDLRQASHILAEHYRDAPDLDETFPATVTRADPDGDGFTMAGEYLVHRPVSRSVNKLRVRVQIQTWRVDVADPDDVIIRCYSMNRAPDALAGQLGPIPEFVRFFSTVSIIDIDDGSGTTGGDWYEFDLIPIARDNAQRGTWLALAFDVQDRGGGGTADQRWRVRAWTCEPGIEVVAGELPIGGGLS